KRALVGLVVDLGDARNIERASFDAVAAADAFVVVEVDDAVGVLHDRPGRRACFQAARIFAVHTAVLADQPLQVLRLRIHPLGEAHDGEHVRRQIRRIVIDADVLADRNTHVVPFKAGRLASLAADALRHVDELGHLGKFPSRWRHARGGALDQVLFAVARRDVLGWCRGKNEFEIRHRRLPYATGPAMGSILTRKALYSGVSMSASPTKGASEFGPKPFFAAPVKPQCSGMPTTCTALPSHCSGLM